MELDLQGFTDLCRHDEVFFVFMQVHIFAILSELDGMPLVALFEAREADFSLQCLESEKPLKGFGKAVCKALYRCGWDMLASASFETSGEIILARERPLVLILCFDRFKHLIIEVPRLDQALHEQVGLCFIRIQAIFVCSHDRILVESLEPVKRTFPPAGGRPFIPIALR